VELGSHEVGWCHNRITAVELKELHACAVVVTRFRIVVSDMHCMRPGAEPRGVSSAVQQHAIYYCIYRFNRENPAISTLDILRAPDLGAILNFRMVRDSICRV
jgi:hypothetical protein